MGRFQFSLRTLLATVAVVATLATLWSAEPCWQLGVVEALLVGWALTSAAMLSTVAAGKTKAIWMGVTVECTLLTIIWVISGGVALAGNRYDLDDVLSKLWLVLYDLSSNFQPLLLSWEFSPVVGLLCVFTHWLLIRPPESKA